MEKKMAKKAKWIGFDFDRRIEQKNSERHVCVSAGYQNLCAFLHLPYCVI